MKPIYEPKGAAKESGDLAINIYTGCPHRCFYCYAHHVWHINKEQFHSCVEPRDGIVEAVKRQIDKEHITGKLIHLCFTCDPYPTGYDTTPTREIIKILKDSGNHVQILTKGDGSRDFDLLDGDDWYGITDDCSLYTAPMNYKGLRAAFEKGIKTWISFEPVINTGVFFARIPFGERWANKVKIGKLNYCKSNIDWKEFGKQAEALCHALGIDYTIKSSLLAEMEKEEEHL